MRSIRFLSHAAPLLMLATALSVSACSDSKEITGPGDPTIVGTWQATSFEAFGADAIADGMTFKATFTAGGAYTFVVTNDKLGFCGDAAGPDCTPTGNYTSTASQVTIDAGTEDATTLNYAINGSTMTFGGNIDGTKIAATWKRVS